MNENFLPPIIVRSVEGSYGYAHAEIIIASSMILISILFLIGSSYMLWRMHKLKREVKKDATEALQLRKLALDEKFARDEAGTA